MENNQVIFNSVAKSLKLQKTILLIDDSVDLLQVQKMILELEGFQVFTADSGRKAFEVLKEISAPDLILLDMQIGDMNGLEFLTELEEKMPKIVDSVPVVFQTGSEEVPKSKAVGFIRKAIEMPLFIKQIQKFVLTTREPYKH